MAIGPSIFVSRGRDEDIAGFAAESSGGAQSARQRDQQTPSSPGWLVVEGCIGGDEGSEHRRLLLREYVVISQFVDEFRSVVRISA